MTGPQLVPLWFVRDLMVVVVFSPIIHWLIKHFAFAPVLAFGVCYFCRVFIPIHGFSASCFFFFSLGAYFSISGKNMVAALSRFRYPAYVIAMAAAIVLVWTNGRKGGEVAPLPQWVHFLYYTYVVAAVISAVSIAEWLLSTGRVRVNRWLAGTTFFIFVAHVLVLREVKRVTYHFLPADCYPLMTLEYLVRPLMTVAICIALYWLLERYLPRLLAILTGGRAR